MQYKFYDHEKLRLAALPGNTQPKAVAPMVGINRNARNEKATTLLGWAPRSNEEVILASAESILKYKSF